MTSWPTVGTQEGPVPLGKSRGSLRMYILVARNESKFQTKRTAISLETPTSSILTCDNHEIHLVQYF